MDGIVDLKMERQQISSTERMTPSERAFRIRVYGVTPIFGGGASPALNEKPLIGIAIMPSVFFYGSIFHSRKEPHDSSLVPDKAGG